MNVVSEVERFHWAQIYSRLATYPSWSIELPFGLQLCLELGGTKLVSINTQCLEELSAALLLLCNSSDDVVLPQLVFSPAQLLQMGLIRSIGDSQGAEVGPHARQWSILTNTHGTVDLDGTVDDFQSDLRGLDLGLGNLLESKLGIFLIRLDGGVEHNQSGRVNLDSCLCHPLEQDAVLSEGLAEGDLSLVVQAVDHPLQGSFAGSNGSHGVVNTARSQSSLHDLVASAFTENHGVEGDLDIIKANVAVAVRGVIITIHTQHAVHDETGDIGRNQQHTLSLIWVWVVGVCLSHDDEDLAAIVASARGPPLAAVEDVMVSLALNSELDISAVTAGNVGLGHEETRPDLAIHQWLQPFVFLCGRAISSNDFHVSRIGCGAVTCLELDKRKTVSTGSMVVSTASIILTYLTGNCALAQLLRHQAIFNVGKLRAVLEMVLGQKHVPDALVPSLALQVIHNAGVTLPSCFASADLGCVDGLGGDGFFFDEFLDLDEEERKDDVSWVQKKRRLGKQRKDGLSRGMYLVQKLQGSLGDKGDDDWGDFL